MPSSSLLPPAAAQDKHLQRAGGQTEAPARSAPHSSLCGAQDHPHEPRRRAHTHRACLAVLPLRIHLHGNRCDHTNHFRGWDRVFGDHLRVLKVAVLNRRREWRATVTHTCAPQNQPDTRQKKPKLTVSLSLFLQPDCSNFPSEKATDKCN